ncbi:glycerophosphoryl diester phosphodiesterase [Ochromonadaceae sp. CCMP2298]|nr:glycerophosphoryl diester phosphodiesterase [Ochromonadaceae sp. CCMP2298]|mmetsp:Transcript_5654/g.12311  ORF Transcript_5654/g.12311 Transcript_5654/m.12311 type:complete len:274 (-) Transcript_5654:222-1043(-)
MEIEEPETDTGIPAIHGFPPIIAHKGGGSLAPENTLLAIKTAQEFNVPAIEIDVMLASDDVPMLMHDKELTRTTMDEEYNGVLMNSLTSSELGTVDVGSYFNPDLIDVFVPTLEEVLEHCLENKVSMNIEIKPAKGEDEKTGRIVAETVARYYYRLVKAGVEPVFSSFSKIALMAAKKEAAFIPRAYLISKPLDQVNWQKHASEIEVVSVAANAVHITEEQVQEIILQGYSVLCYTVNDVDKAMELLDWGVSHICTDQIDTFGPLSKQLLAER